MPVYYELVEIGGGPGGYVAEIRAAQLGMMVACGGLVDIRPMMHLALSYDHRVVDGREAVTFLVRVKECIESPDRILLDM